MIDVTILGDGLRAGACADVLSRSGLRLRRSSEMDEGGRSPIILGEVPSVFTAARQAAEAGRHLLIANPAGLTPERLELLLASRKRSQALFVWNERRYHPGYRFVSGLMEADSTWRPRYLRQETLSGEPTTSVTARWLVLETLGLVHTLVDETATSVMATGATNRTRNAPDILSFSLKFPELDAYVQVGLGEPVERREMVLAAHGRKAFVDELNVSTPVRLIEEERSATRGSTARWLSCGSASEYELAREQCLSFLDSTLQTPQAQAEADLWLRSLAVLRAAETSIGLSAPAKVGAVKAEPRFRLISGRAMAPTLVS